MVPTADLTVNWATGGGTATADADYTAGSATLTFTQSAPGAQTFTVVTLDDSVDEPGETFEVTLSNPTGGGGPAPTLNSAKTTFTTTITDDDDTPTAVTLTVDHSTLGESAAAADIVLTATLVGSSTLPDDLVVAVTLGGTADSSDYSASALASIIIPGGSPSGSGSLRVTPTQDLVVEGSETIEITGDRRRGSQSLTRR